MRELHSLTEQEVLELFSIAETRLCPEKQENENIVEFIKDNGFWSKHPFLGPKYVIFKSSSEFPDRQTLYIPITWESRGIDDSEAGVHPYHIEIGTLTGMMGDYYSPAKVIEWFLKKGFDVGDFTLKSKTESPTCSSIEQDAEAWALNNYCLMPEVLSPIEKEKFDKVISAYIAGASAHSVPESVMSAEEILDKHFKSYHDDQFIPKSGKPIKRALIDMLQEFRSLNESVKGGMKWVRATDRLPEPFRQKYLKNGANWDLGHYDDAADDFLCLSGWSKRKDLIQWLDESAEPTPPQPTGDVKILLGALSKITEEGIRPHETDSYYPLSRCQHIASKAFSSYQSKNKGGGE